MTKQPGTCQALRHLRHSLPSVSSPAAGNPMKHYPLVRETRRNVESSWVTTASHPTPPTLFFHPASISLSLSFLSIFLHLFEPSPSTLATPYPLKTPYYLSPISRRRRRTSNHPASPPLLARLSKREVEASTFTPASSVLHLYYS